MNRPVLDSRWVTAGALFFMAARATLAAELNPVTADEFRTVIAAERGNVVLVNFWATWCRPCLEEIPLLMELESELAAKGFSLIAVSLDDAASADELVKPFMEKWFPEFSSYQNLEYEMDKIVSVIDPAWNEILPTSYVLAADGTVAELIQGARTKAEFRASIEAALAESN
jgi:thiol-disulfide isomerase/thioredoxin